MRLDFHTGEIDPSLHSVTRTIGDLAQIFQNQIAVATLDPSTIVYQTYGCPGDSEGEQLLYGTTVLMPGTVGDEYYMTRGHFHTKPERGELCLTIKGEGKLLLMDRSGNTTEELMSAGSLHNIDGRLAHRVVNTGTDPLVFFVSWMSDCGHDYESIRQRGFPVQKKK